MRRFGRSYTYERIDPRMEALDDWYLDQLRNQSNFFGQGTGTTSGNESEQNTAGKNDESVYKYRVQKDENLLTLAGKFSVSMLVISDMNGLNGRQLQEGDVIQLPGYAQNVPAFVEEKEEDPQQQQSGDKSFYEQATEATAQSSMVPAATGTESDNFGYVVTAPVEPENYPTYGIYYGAIVPALAVVTKSRREAQDLAVSKGYTFYYDVDPVTRKQSILRQPNATEVYNRQHYAYSADLVDQVNFVAQDNTLANRVKTEQDLGPSFTLLVKEAQEKMFTAPIKNIGMYDSATKAEVEKRIKEKQEKDEALTGPLSVENLNLNIQQNATYAQQLIIINLQDTGGLYGAASGYLAHNWDDDMRRRYMNQVLDYRELAPDWKIDDWKYFITNGYLKDIQAEVPRLATFDQLDEWEAREKNKPGADAAKIERIKSFTKAWNFFRQMWYDVPEADQQLYLVLMLEETSIYGAMVGGKINDYDSFRLALDNFMNQVDDKLSTKEHIDDPTSPTFKGFYEHYLWVATQNYLDQQEKSMTDEYSRYVTTSNGASAQGPEMQAMMADLAAIYPHIEKARASYSSASSKEKVTPLSVKGGTHYYNSGASASLSETRTERANAVTEFNLLKTKYPILSASEFSVTVNDAYNTAAEGTPKSTGNYYMVEALIEGGYKKDFSVVSGQLKSVYESRISSINSLRGELNGDPGKLWLLDKMVEKTKTDLGFTEGSPFTAMIDSWKLRAQHEYESSVITVIGQLALGVATFVQPEIAPATLPIMAGLSGYNLMQSIEDYQFKSAAAGTAYDKSQSLEEPPPLIWVIIDAVGLILDVVDAVKAIKLYRAMGRDLSTIMFKDGKLITDAKGLERVRAQIKDKLTRVYKYSSEQAEKYAAAMTDQARLTRLQDEQTERETLLAKKKDVPLEPMPPKIQNLVNDETLGQIFKAGAYRLQDIAVGESNMLRLLLNNFAEAEPKVMANILKAAGESDAVAGMFGKIYTGVNGKITFTDFIRSEFSKPLDDPGALFRRLSDDGVTPEEISAAADEAKTAKTPSGATTLFHSKLIEIAETKEKTLLSVKSGTSAVKPGTVYTPKTDAQIQLEAAIDKMTPEEAQKFLDDLEKTKAKMDPDEYDALKKKAQDRINASKDVEPKLNPGKTLEEIKNSIKERIKNLGEEFKLVYTDEELDQIILKGKELGLDDKTIEDFAVTGSRVKKAIPANELITQMENYANIVVPRGYPFLFENLGKFEQFKTRVKSLLEKYGIPVTDIRIQGSSLRTATAKDIDIAVFVSEEDFNRLVEEMRNGIMDRAQPHNVPGLLEMLDKQVAEGRVGSFLFNRLEDSKFTFNQELQNLNEFIQDQKPIEMSIMEIGKNFDLGPFLKF